MSLTFGQVPAPPPVGEARQGNALLAILAVNLIIGVGFLAILLALPSKAENVLIGRYSRERILLLSGVALATLLIAILGLALKKRREWRARLGTRLLGQRGIVRQGLPYLPILLVTGMLVPLLAFPAQIQTLTNHHYARLSPYLVWPVMFAASLVVGYWVLWSRPRIHLAKRELEGVSLLLLFLLSFGARAPLSGYGLPYQAVWDEVVTYPRALELLSGMQILEDGAVPGYGRASYGDLVVYVTAAGQAVGLLSKLRTGAVGSVTGFSSPAEGVGSVFEAVHGSGAPLQYPRILFAVITSICPLLIYGALRRHFDVSVWVAFAGGLLFAILNPDVIYYSAFIWPDAMATTMALAALICGMEIIRSIDSTRWAELACGALVGACISMSIRYVSLIPIPFAAIALSPYRRKWGERIAVMAIALIGGFLITSPTVIVDFPGYLTRMAALSWVGNDSLANRVISLSFYSRGAFLGGGFGLLVLALTLVGYSVALQRRRRITLFLTLIAGLHLFLITPTLFRVTRHALVLYPFVAIFAALALGLAQDHLPGLLLRIQAGLLPNRSPTAASKDAAGVVVLLVFVVAALPKLQQTVSFIEQTRSFQPSQVQMAEYVREHLVRDTRVALLEIIPFADVHLRRSRADVHRVGLGTTLEELREGGYEYVIGTDGIGGEFGEGEGTIWTSEFLSEQQALAEFGSEDLTWRGWPVGNIHLYLARLPQSDPVNPAP